MPIRLVLLILVLVTAWPLTAGAQDREVPSSQEEIRLSFAPVVEATAPAVVNIYASRMVEERARSPLFRDPFFERFFGDRMPEQRRQREQRSLGSGVIVDPEGLIVTNEHVVRGAQEITVVLHDRREFSAEIVLTDERTDLAVLRMDPGDLDLNTLELGDSDSLAVGDLVLAIGNPFGVGQTVTSGIVSGLARTTVGISDYNFFIQTDAAINPGNSGGALVTLDGKLVGVNTAIFSRSGGSVGIGFAIPASMVRAVVAGVQTDGRVVRPWLGMTGQSVTADLAEGLGLDRPGGTIVREVYPGGPADRAGLRRGDVILEIAGRDVQDLEALRFRVAARVPEGSVPITVYRTRDGARELTLPLEVPPEEPERAETLIEGRNPLTGATVANLSPALAEELDRPGEWQGVAVLEVRRGAPAAGLGFRPGDVILAINGEPVARTQDLQRQLEASGPRWRVRYRRDGRVNTVEIAL